MKRGLLSVAALLGVAIGYVHADYVKLIVNLSATRERAPEGAQGGIPGMGVPGMGTPGAMPPGAMPPGMAPGMAPGGGRFGAGGEDAGAPAGRGMMAPPGMTPGGGGGFPPGSGAGGGLPGSLSGGAGGRFGAGQGPPGMDPMGMGSPDGGGPGGAVPPGAMAPGGFGAGGVGGAGAFEEPESSPFYVECVIELDHRANDRKTFNKGWGWRPDPKDPRYGRVILKHKWGETSLYPPVDIVPSKSPSGQTTILTSKQVQIVHTRYPTVLERQEEWLKKNAKDAKADDYVKQAEWCLTHGLVNDVPKMLDIARTKGSGHPALGAFKKLEEAAKKPLSKEDGSDLWRMKLGENYKVRQSKHYTLLYDGHDARAGLWLNQMEEHYNAFYYWFALKGIALNQPERRMLALLVDQKEEFEHHHKDIFDQTPMASDGFYVPRDQIAVYSAKRLDEAYEALVSMTAPVLQSFKREQLLEGKGWSKTTTPEATAHAQVLALIMQSLEEEAERYAITHEGTRQLIRAIGLVPRGVAVPRWLDLGLASFFETPKQAYWPGGAGPHWSYLSRYRFWDESKKLDKADESLRSVVTDRYFQLAETETDKDKKEKADRKARTMSWALVFYLMEEKREGVIRYFQELSSMPRDMEFDEDVLFGVFARAFDMADPTKQPPAVDLSKVNTASNKWYAYMKGRHLDITEVMLRQVQDYKQALADGKGGQALQRLQNQGPNAAPQAPPGGGLQKPPGRAGGGKFGG